MRATVPRTLLLCAVVIAANGATVAVAQVEPNAESRSWTVKAGTVRVTCPLTIGGSFDAKTTALTGALSAPDTTSAPFNGEMAVDLRTLDTGIALRNEHLKEKYLHVDAQPGFDRAMLSNIQAGISSAEIPSGERPFTARLQLHGAVRQVSGRVSIRQQGTDVYVEASFPVRLSEFGIPAPRYLGVGVKEEVSVRVAFTASSVATSTRGPS